MVQIDLSWMDEDEVSKPPTQPKVSSSSTQPKEDLSSTSPKIDLSWMDEAEAKPEGEAEVKPEEENSSFMDFLQDENVLQDELSAHSSLQETINLALSDLSNREKEIINLRFGINNSEILTLDEIGRRFSLTRERIRQIEKKALRKIEKNYGLSLKGFLN